jgi:hypothetical protein
MLVCEYIDYMKSIVNTLIGILITVGILAILWFTYRDRFNIDITLLATEAGCVQAVNDSESQALAEFEDKALEAIGGAGFSDNLPDPLDFSNWKPTIESLKLLLDTDSITDMALARLRTSLAENQQTDPTSLLNRQKTNISNMFQTARSWCTTLPDEL